MYYCVVDDCVVVQAGSEWETIRHRLKANDPSLVHLDMSEEVLILGNAGLKKLCKALRHNTVLTRLCLLSQDLSDLPMPGLPPGGGAVLLAELLAQHPRIEELNLAGNRLGEVGAVHMARALILAPR